MYHHSGLTMFWCLRVRCPEVHVLRAWCEAGLSRVGHSGNSSGHLVVCSVMVCGTLFSCFVFGNVISPHKCAPTCDAARRKSSEPK